MDQAKHRAVQEIQSGYRHRIADHWRLNPGAKLLEVGCGQGDMTAILAGKVGENGTVMAVDIAKPSYGAPLTLFEATKEIKRSDVGPRIDFQFEFDLLSPEVEFSEGFFDGAVLVHSPWYFSRPGELRQTFTRLRGWSRRLYLAEWDLEPRSTAQFSHLLAVLIQAQVEVFKTDSEANIRMPISRNQMKSMIAETGWTVIHEHTLATDGMQDPDWEIQACLANSLREANEISVPAKTISLLEAQVDVLTSMAMSSGNHPLDSYVLSAE